MVNKKQAIIGLVIVVVVVAAVAVYFVVSPGGGGVRKYIMYLDWVPIPAHTHLFVAKELYWLPAGLDVELVRSSGSSDVAAKVGSGVGDFGHLDYQVLAKAQTADILPITAVDGLDAKFSGGVYYIKNRDAGRGIIDGNDLKTLEGKILGEPIWSNIVAAFPAFCRLVGVDPSKVEIKDIDPAATLAAVLKGDTDMAGMILGDWGTYKAGIEAEGKEAGAIWFADYGLTLVGYVDAVNNHVLYERPDDVRKFVEGVQKGFQYTVAHPDEAFAIFAKYAGWEGREGLAKEMYASTYAPIINEEVMNAHGIGYMDPALMESSYKTAMDMHQIPSEFWIDWHKSFTNEFVNPSITLGPIYWK